MTTDKTKSVQVRLSIETLDYLAQVQKENRCTLSEAIRLVILERELNDKIAGEITPFKYLPAPTPRKKKTIEGSAPRRSASMLALRADKVEPSRIDRAKPSTFGPMTKTVFVGTDEEWNAIPDEIRARMIRG